MLSSDLTNKLDSLAWCYCVVTRETGVEFPGRDLALERKLIPDSELGVLIWLHHVGTIRQRKKNQVTSCGKNTLQNKSFCGPIMHISTVRFSKQSLN